MKWPLLLLAVLFLSAAAPGSIPAAHAGHATIDCTNPSLTDLATAVQANLGSSQGGFDQDSTADFGMHSGNIYTQSCKYINGFDMVHAYMFVDFKEPDGSRSPTTAVYAGWQVTGVIGDVDGDGNPDLRTSNNPLCGGQILQDLQGIGRDEFYILRMVLCSGTIVQVTITNGGIIVTKDGVQIATPASVTRVFSGSTLKLCITNLEAIIGNEDINGMQLAMTSNASYDFLGEDGTNLVQLNLPNTIDVAKIPSSPTVCPNGQISYTISIRNPGVTTLNTITVTDVLQNGQTWVSDDQGSTGDATTRNWSFPTANLVPGGSLVIHLIAAAPASCSGTLADFVSVTGNNTCGTAGEASADTTATVLCGEPVVSIRDTSTCVGVATTLCAQIGGPSAIATYEWTGPGGPFGNTQCITIPASAVGGAGPVAYHVKVTDVSGCTDEDDGTVTVLENPGVAIRDTSTCQGVSTTLCAIQTSGASAIAHYTWTGPGGPFTDAQCITIPGSAFSKTGSNDYHVSVTDGNGCEGSDDGTISVTARPPCSISPRDTTIEVGGTARLCGPSGAFTYLWSTGQTTQCIDVTAAGRYVLTVTSSVACSTSCTATVRILESGRCWLTGGGQSYDADGHLHSYGGVINPGCSPTAAGGGNWNDRDHTTGAHFKGETVVVDLCGNVPGIPPGSSSPKTPFNFIEFHGTGTITGIQGNKKTPVFFNGHYEDRSEPGSLGQRDTTKKDRYFLRVYTDSTNKVGTTVMLVDVDDNAATQDPTAIYHGNLQLHVTGCDKPKNGALETGDPPATFDIVDLPEAVSFGMPRPNPTGVTMSIRYGLPSEARVTAQVFDVAGRMVRDLGDGIVSAGWHTMQWDLRSDTGQRAIPGLYFLRMSVNGETQVRHITVLQ